ncbi:hypothetical protein QBC45DRAFT_407705 [Copromyces sp. CBS 386.78]|nr:hypothetical protein QBC45DRAFT_407705 [Copromyces sp. CBS 386.78]
MFPKPYTLVVADFVPLAEFIVRDKKPAISGLSHCGISSSPKLSNLRPHHHHPSRPR